MVESEAKQVYCGDYGLHGGGSFFFPDVIGLSRIMDCFSDFRTNPVIPLHHIVGTIIWMPFFGVRSLLAADAIGRRRRMRELFATVKRKMVVSDTTMKRVLKWCQPQWSRQVLLRLVAPFEQLQLLKRALIHGGRPRRVGLIDGSYLGNRFCVCLTLLGRVRLPVMLEPAGEGKEIPVAMYCSKRQTASSARCSTTPTRFSTGRIPPSTMSR